MFLGVFSEKFHGIDPNYFPVLGNIVLQLNDIFFQGGNQIIEIEVSFFQTEHSRNKVIPNKKENEKNLLRQLHAGSLKFVMHGKKLKGEFALVKTAYRGENSWLLIKHRDDYASAEDITKKDKSVTSKKTLEQVEKTSDRIWKSNREAKSKPKTQKLKTTTADSSTSKTVSKKKTKRRSMMKT